MKPVPAASTPSPGAAIEAPSRSLYHPTPENMRPEFDMVHELTRRSDEYVGERCVTLYNLPRYILTALEYVQHATPVLPSIHKTACCALSGGLGQIRRARSISDLIEVRASLYSFDAGEGDPVEEVADWFRSFDFALPNPGTKRPIKRRNVNVSDAVKRRLEDQSGRLGATYSAVAQLALAVSLSQQKEAQNAEKVRDAVRAVNKSIEMRVAMARGLMSWLDSHS